MAGAVLKRLFGALRPTEPPAQPLGDRLVFERQPQAIYAVGDIHGCLDLLLELEAQIAADAAELGGEGWLVTLGDGVDRGPATAQVIDHLRGPAPAGLRRINLMGNHEAMMLDFLRRPRADSLWLRFGGIEALMSYGVPADRLERLDNRMADQLVHSYIPAEHFDYLAALPLLLDSPAAVFVHAGLRPGANLDAQLDEDLLWYRDEFRADFSDFGKPVVHGHTVREAPLVSPYRIAIDTGAVFSGELTAVRIDGSGPPHLFSTPRWAASRKAAML